MATNDFHEKLSRRAGFAVGIAIASNCECLASSMCNSCIELIIIIFYITIVMYCAYRNPTILKIKKPSVQFLFYENFCFVAEKKKKKTVRFGSTFYCQQALFFTNSTSPPARTA